MSSVHWSSCLTPEQRAELLAFCNRPAFHCAMHMRTEVLDHQAMVKAALNALEAAEKRIEALEAAIEKLRPMIDECTNVENNLHGIAHTYSSKRGIRYIHATIAACLLHVTSHKE